MSFQFRRSRLSILLLTLSLQACVQDGGGSNSAPVLSAATASAGYVSFGNGVAQAQVQMTDLKAATPAAHIGSTTSGGMYLGTRLPAGGDYRIEASNGVLGDGSAIDGTLAVEIRNYADGTIHLNPVTTLVSRYLAAQPSLSLAQAEEAVRRFLQLPAHQDLGAGLAVNTAEFSYGTFRVAMGDTGFDAFIARLVAEMNASPDATHPFPPQRMLQLGEGGLAVYVGEKLVAGALGEIGGVAMGNVLSSMGMGGSDQSPEILAQLAQIQSTLRQMQSQLTNLEAQTSAIQGELKSLQYNSGVNVLTPIIITTVKNLTTTLSLLINLSPSDYRNDPNGWNKVRSDLYNGICSIYIEGRFGATADVFDDVLRGTQTATPLITLFGQSRTTGRVLFNYQDSQDLYAVRQYWETIQAHLFNLIDIYLATGQSNDGCASKPNSTRFVAAPGTALQAQRAAVAKGFDDRQRKQVAMYPTQLLPKDTAIDIQNKTMLRTDIPYRKALYLGTHPSYRYSPTQNSAWNYANLTMNSDQSPMSANPAYLRQGWRLISRNELLHYFGSGNAIAVQKGWPAASTWWDAVAVCPDQFALSSVDYVIGWQPSSNRMTSLENPATDAVTISVRPLVADEDYLPK